MSLNYSPKINLNLTGVSFTDVVKSNVGSGVFNLPHSWFVNDTSSGTTLVIRTAGSSSETYLLKIRIITFKTRILYFLILIM